jgi:hypothetical protein
MANPRIVLLTGLLCAASVWAEEPPPRGEAPLPPEVAAPQEPEEIVITEGQKTPGATPPAEIPPPPEVRVIQRPDALIEEYRQNGRLYMVKIVPRFGPPYYLVDSDGDGSLESRRFELDSGTVPQWMLFSW